MKVAGLGPMASNYKRSHGSSKTVAPAGGRGRGGGGGKRGRKGRGRRRRMYLPVTPF
jgi:hypothetical protein